jgi:hypothetical protein
MNTSLMKTLIVSGGIIVGLFLLFFIIRSQNSPITSFPTTGVTDSVGNATVVFPTSITNNKQSITTGLSPIYGCATVIPRLIPSKPSHTVIKPGQSHNRIIVRFINGSGIRLREGKIISLTEIDLQPIDAVLDSFNFQTKRLYSDSEEKLDIERLKLERETCKELADMNLAYLFILDDDQDTEKFIDLLNALPIVEIAYPESSVVNP